MASGAYPSSLDCVVGNVDYDTDTFYMMLVGTGYTPDYDTHTRRSNVTANEVSGTGYTAGGASVTVTVSSFNTTTNKITITVASKTFGGVTLTGVRYAVVYKRRGGADTADELIACIDNGSGLSSGTGGSITVNATTYDLELNAP